MKSTSYIFAFMPYKWRAIAFCIFIELPFAFGQTEAFQPRPIPSENWQKAIGHLDYSDDVSPPAASTPRPQPSEPSELPQLNWLSDALKVVLVGTLFLAVGWLVYSLWRFSRNPVLKREENAPVVRNLSERSTPQNQLFSQLQQAIVNEEYRLAVRLHFLIVLERLAQGGALRWSREKTNQQYLQEIKDHPLSSSFREAVLFYERAWYGNEPVSANHYDQKIAPLFDALVKNSVFFNRESL
ncbi:MAG: DUF4129 domain-containing protein [Saprospiraceae bacterium]|nr:DUF4129 domain-containing protein [Saprospiraceae bacterium]MDW8483950.1 DUF4129 domain-containing protein [Saprospiraceae bacterium]